MLLLAVALAIQPESSCLALRIAASKDRLVVGESTRIEIVWRAKCDTELAAPSGSDLLIDDGHGYRLFLDIDDEEHSCGVEGNRTLRAGEEFRTSVLAGVTGLMESPADLLDTKPRFAFPGAGRYRLKVHRRDVSSNVVTVKVRPPRGVDAAVFDELKVVPELQTRMAMYSGRYAEALQMVARHGPNAYLGRMQMALWEFEIANSPILSDAAGRLTVDSEARGSLLKQIEAADLRGSGFEVDRLLLVARSYEAMRDGAAAERIYARITKEYPTTAAAYEAAGRRRADTLEE